MFWWRWLDLAGPGWSSRYGDSSKGPVTIHAGKPVFSLSRGCGMRGLHVFEVAIKTQPSNSCLSSQHSFFYFVIIHSIYRRGG